MKKVIITLAMTYATLCPAISTIVPSPIISRGKPVYTSSGSASYLVDNKFGGSSFTVSNNSWIAIEVDTAASISKIFFNWNNPVYAWSNELSPAKCPNSNLFPVDYNLLTSSNSTDGVDGDWIIADSIRGNIVTARGHLIDFSGANWVKMQIITGGGQISEVEVFDASEGGDSADVWFFAGTSITANAFKQYNPTQNFADLVNEYHPGYNPAMIRGGIGCISSTDFVNNISKYLKMAGKFHYWAIEMGTNDAWGGTNDNVALFTGNMQKVIDSCKEAGVEPIIARMIATNKSNAKWQVHPDFLKAIDSLTAQNSLIPGPDLYTWFVTHPKDLGSDGIHPNPSGAASIQRLWAQKMTPLYGGCAVTDIVPYLKKNSGSLSINLSAALVEGDTLTLSPQPLTGGSWTWSGPNGFSSTSREVVIDSIQTDQAGEYIANFTDNNSCSNSVTITITVKKVQSIINSNSISDNINIFPNPAERGKFRILLKNLSSGSRVYIYDMLGKLSYSSILTEKETEINTRLAGGIYFVKIVNEQFSLNQKLVIR